MLVQLPTSAVHYIDGIRMHVWSSWAVCRDCKDVASAVVNAVIGYEQHNQHSTCMSIVDNKALLHL
jgi:hypothetical protein